ncbi:MAG TPA: hypothetical protein VMI54_23825 [Polyangiaceae bacterium]|nr:hypothetical protein [Polyangiaceae bacterium]
MAAPNNKNKNKKADTLAPASREKPIDRSPSPPGEHSVTSANTAPTTPMRARASTAYGGSNGKAPAAPIVANPVAGSAVASASKDGLRPALGPVVQAPPLMDPRVPVWKDLLAAQRAWLLAGPSTGRSRPAAQQRPRLVRKALVRDEQANPEMDALVYTYTRNDRFVTDGMGYGEEMQETLAVAGKKVVRMSRRTTTGRQTLSIK